MIERTDCDQLPALRDCGKCTKKNCRTLGKGISGMIAEEFEKALTFKRPLDMAGLTARIKSEFPGVI